VGEIAARSMVALRHQRVMPNDDGSITLLLLER
jgi:hypothetical protein